jgi:DNA-binding transcriptional MocR family regulator
MPDVAVRSAAGPAARPARRVGVRELVPLLAGWQDRPGVPGYQALADRLRLLVLDGRLPVHAVLPSERALATASGTSRTTTTAAYRALREAGFAAAGQGAGTWTALPNEPAPPAGDPAALPWPVTTTGRRGTADGRGDLSSAALEAPPQVHAAYVAALADLPRYLPGHGYVTAGLDVLRERVAARYTARGLPTAPDEVLVTSGAIHGLRLVLGETVARGDRVLVESPTYPLALDVVRRAGARPVALPVEDGWDPDAAAEALRSTGARAAYLMPDFQNPTGALMTDDVRERLADVLARAGCLVVVDETTADLDLRGPGAVAPAPFGAGRRPGPGAGVVHLGSSSKTFWGGLRVGWVRADRALVQRLTVARAADDLASPLVEQLATAHLLDVVDTLLPQRRALVAARCAALRGALAERLPQWEAPVPAGGLVLWCRLPLPRSSALAAAVRDLGVTVTPGPRFGPDGAFESRLRIPFARPEADLVAAVGLLARAWHGGAVPGAAGAGAVPAGAGPAAL